MNAKNHNETIVNLIGAAYNILLLFGVFLFLIILVSPLMKQFGINRSTVPFVDDLGSALFSMLLIIAPLFFLSRRKVTLGYQPMKSMLFLFGYSLLLIPFLPLCTGALFMNLPTFHVEHQRTNLATFLTCPMSLSGGVSLIIFLFSSLVVAFNIAQIIAHVYYYVTIKKKMEPLIAFGMSLFFGVVLIGVLVRLFELAGNLLWR